MDIDIKTAFSIFLGVFGFCAAIGVLMIGMVWGVWIFSAQADKAQSWYCEQSGRTASFTETGARTCTPID